MTATRVFCGCTTRFANVLVLILYIYFSSEWANVCFWLLSFIPRPASGKAVKPGVWDQDSSLDLYQVFSGKLNC